MEGFQNDVLMLVVDDSPYGEEVPIQIGTLHINMILEAAEQNPTAILGDSWERAKLASSLKMGRAFAEAEAPEIDLDSLMGNIINMQKIELQPFKSRVISGTMKGPIREAGIFKRVNVLTEPTEAQMQGKSCFSAVPAYTYISPGLSRAQAVLKNLTARPVTLGRGQIVASIKPGNEVPKMLASKNRNVENGRGPEACPRVSKPDEGPREVSRVNLKQGVCQPKEQKFLTVEQLKELHKKLQLKVYTAGWKEEWKTELYKLLEEFSFLFAMDSMDMGKTDLIQHHIELTDYTPIKDRYRRIPIHQYEEVRKHLKEMLEVGAICKSNSPWASPVVLVRKKGGLLRFCIDLRRLNARTVKDAYSLPRIEDALDSLDGACLFTSLDLKSGYWQVELDEESIPLTAFTVGPLGFYECVRMPFRLTNAPTMFQHLMESCLGKLHLNWCIIYLDDIIIFSKTPEEHLKRLRGVFE